MYLSTVKGDAPVSAYEGISNRAVNFVPGETEKSVTIRAKDFSQDGQFGIRIESTEADAKFDNYYQPLYILAADSASAAKSQKSQDSAADNQDAAELQEAGVLGAWTWRNHDFYWSDWSGEITGGDGGNRAQPEGWAAYVRQYDSGKHSMVYSKYPYNLNGVYCIVFYAYTYGEGSKYTTYFETDSDQSFPGSTASNSWNGDRDWSSGWLWVRGVNGNHYIKFATKANAGGKHNPWAYLDWFDFYYTKYSFSPQNSDQIFQRKLYDFTTGSPTESVTYFDGQTTRGYNPGSVVIKRSNGETVNAFYGNANETVIITANDEARSYGFKLKSVRFQNNNNNNNAYEVSANGSGEVRVTLNQDFVGTLINRGVVNSSNQENETIKVVPTFEQETVTVNFENRDWEYAGIQRGKFDASHLASHFANIVNSGKLTKNFYGNWLDYYSFTNIPKGSVIRLKVVPDSHRTPAGAVWWPWATGQQTRTYYKKGAKAFSYDQPNGTTITDDDPTIAEIVANTNISIAPVTGEQTFYVGYSPLGRDYLDDITNEAGKKLVTSLEGAVVSGDILNPSSQRTNADGYMWLDDAFTGNQYNLTSYPPDGYYTYWGNLSGDTNNDGTVDEKDDYTARMDAANSKNARYVYGSRLNMTVDTDNPRYYYEYLPLSNGSGRVKSGAVMREVNTFYRLVNKMANTGTEPVANAEINVAGFRGRTDKDGKYSIRVSGLPNWGSVSTLVMADGSEYSIVTPVEQSVGKSATVTLSAFEQFQAKSLTASYGSNKINGSSAAILDDDFDITATVTTENSIYPARVRFEIRDKDGNIRTSSMSAGAGEDEDSPDGYETTLRTSGNNYIAKLSFNPKQDMQSGDTVWIQFADQNGKWYSAINLGYKFTAILNLKEFLLPALGVQSADNLEKQSVRDDVLDLIGDPDSGLLPGLLDDLKMNTYDYTPAAAVYEDDNLTWAKTDYTYGWDNDDDDDKDDDKDDKDDKDKDDDKKNDKDPKESVKKMAEDDDDDKGKKADASFSTKGKFNWKVEPSAGFKLTLSARDGKDYFEDLCFFIKIKANVSASQKISLPYGFAIALGVDLKGDITAAYRMVHTHNADPLEMEDAIEYSAEEFGIFKNLGPGVHRSFYLFINPTISMKMGIEQTVIYVGGEAEFAFDMDFEFTEDETNAYGDLTIKLNWNLDLFGFTVYKRAIGEKNGYTFELFHTDGADGHIELQNVAELQSKAIRSAMMDNGSFALNRPASKAYLANRSEWNETESLTIADSLANLLGLDASEGTKERTIQTGTAENPQMSLTKISDTDMLLVFVGDDENRSDENKRAVYYSILSVTNSGVTLAAPVLLDDDGTPDDYPTICNMGDGGILVV